MNDYCLALVSCLWLIWCFAVALALDAAYNSVSAEPGSQTSALTAEAWTPCDPPRPDVACWRSGQAVVCLPKEKKP